MHELRDWHKLLTQELLGGKIRAMLNFEINSYEANKILHAAYLDVT